MHSLIYVSELGYPHLVKSCMLVVIIIQTMFAAARIDHGHHAGKAVRALNEAVALAKAVDKAISLVDKGKAKFHFKHRFGLFLDVFQTNIDS